MQRIGSQTSHTATQLAPRTFKDWSLMKILLPGSLNLQIEDSVIDAVAYDEREPIPQEHHDAKVLVTWANSRANLASAAKDLGELELVQTVTAGTDRVLAAGFAPSVQIASGRTLHDGPVAEHTLALTLAAVRRLDELAAAQQRREWARDYVAAQADPATAQHYTLDGAHVVIWGFGSIAMRLAPLLQALGARVSGIASTSGTRAGFPVVAAEDRATVLADADVLISLLPATDETEKTFNAECIALLPDSAVFINVGRGATVDEAALIRALTDGTLRYAALDVMDTEPLPETSPLWTAPNLLLTPHVAGGRPQQASALIGRNVAALQAGEPLDNCVSPS